MPCAPLLTLARAACVVGVSIAACPSADAKSAITGVDKIHAQSRVGSKICMISHEHYGEGTLPSRPGAQAAAIRAWQIFTADEYGSAWGNYSIAVAKSMTCSQAGSAWTCKTLARPCRSAR